MVRDFFTKPLQEALYMCRREKILKLPSITSTTIHRSVLEQRKIDNTNIEKNTTNGLLR